MESEIPSRRRVIRLSTALLVVALAAAIAALAVQGRKTAEMERRLAEMERKNAEVERLNNARGVQIGNTVAKFNMYVNKRLAEIDKQIGAIEAARQAPAPEKAR